MLHYAKTTYGTTPEQLWRSHPNFLVLRHKSNQKWYGLIMDVEREKLHLSDDPYREDDIDILNLKCDPNLAGSLMANPGILPAYHMNKANWISVLLDGSVAEEQIFSLLDLSFDLTAGKKAGGRSRSGSRTWVIPANPRYYDLEEAFGESDIITWKQGRGIEAGDTVLIYMAAPVSSILYMCHVLETDIPYSFDDGKVRMDHIMRLKAAAAFSRRCPYPGNTARMRYYRCPQSPLCHGQSAAGGFPADGTVSARCRRVITSHIIFQSLFPEDARWFPRPSPIPRR